QDRDDVGQIGQDRTIFQQAGHDGLDRAGHGGFLRGQLRAQPGHLAFQLIDSDLLSLLSSQVRLPLLAHATTLRPSGVYTPAGCGAMLARAGGAGAGSVATVTRPSRSVVRQRSGLTATPRIPCLTSSPLSASRRSSQVAAGTSCGRLLPPGLKSDETRNSTA